MEAVARLRNFPTSPRKARLVADLIRGQKVNRALSLLKFEARHSSIHIEKVLLSAIANWEQKNPDTKLEDVELYVKTIFVDGGASVKRLRTAPQGRGYRIRKRSHHVTIVVDAIQAPANSAVLNEILNTETEGKQENNA